MRYVFFTEFVKNNVKWQKEFINKIVFQVHNYGN